MPRPRRGWRILPGSSTQAAECSAPGLFLTMGRLQQAFSDLAPFLLRSFQPASRPVGAGNCNRTSHRPQRRLPAALGQEQPLSTLRGVQRLPMRNPGRRLRPAEERNRLIRGRFTRWAFAIVSPLARVPVSREVGNDPSFFVKSGGRAESLASGLAEASGLGLGNPRNCKNAARCPVFSNLATTGFRLWRPVSRDLARFFRWNKAPVLRPKVENP